MCLTGCVRKNDENSEVPQALSKKKGLSQDAKDTIGLFSLIGVLCLAIIIALGLIMWAGVTKAGFNPEWTRWLTLSVGVVTGVPAFFTVVIMSLIATPSPQYRHSSYSYHHYNNNDGCDY